MFKLISVFLIIVTLCGYLNHRFLKLPSTIGVTAVGFMLSIVTIIAANYIPELGINAKNLMTDLDFKKILFEGVLGLLLFASAIHVDINRLKKYKMSILTLATLSVILSTSIVGMGLYVFLRTIGIEISILECFVFGALISPTDPIAVIAVLNKLRLNEDLETKIIGESLLNDASAVVIFVTCVAMAYKGMPITFESIVVVLAREVLGGIAVGLLLGVLGLVLLKDMDDYAVEILVTLSIAVSGFYVAELLHVSEPLAIVIAGLVVGNKGVKYFMSEKTKEHMFSFWTLLDEILNLLLFALIGLELVALSISPYTWGIASMAVPIVLVARFVSLWLPSVLLTMKKNFRHTPKATPIMTWGGLRGAISIALVLTLPKSPATDLLIACTYVVVMFSLLAQATTLEWFIQKISPKHPVSEEDI